eukprot:1279054-Amphidinium_carterae.1
MRNSPHPENQAWRCCFLSVCAAFLWWCRGIQGDLCWGVHATNARKEKGQKLKADDQQQPSDAAKTQEASGNDALTRGAT